MKLVRRISLTLIVVLIITLLNVPAMAAAGSKNDNFTMAVPYTFSIDGENVSLWAFKIGDGISYDAYFKLRDIAMALNGTDKQFAVSWDESKNAVLLTTGVPYAPVGGELNALTTGASLPAIQPTTVFYIDKRLPLRTYTVNDGSEHPLV